MSDKKLLLPEIDLYAICGKHGEPVDSPEYCGGNILYTAQDVRRFYEDLITQGKLMIVGEVPVELVPNNYDCLLTCTGCRDGVPYYLLEEFDEINYCPNCGLKILKP